MIDRYHLRYFLAIIDQGNFSKAAAACNVSQPTLSVGISKLEKTLGRSLFHRTNRRVGLTEAGAQLLDYARRIEASFAQAERVVSGTDLGATTRIGVLVTTPAEWLEAFLERHRQSGLRERLEIVEGRERDLHERLARGRIDIAFTVLQDVPETEQDVLFSEGYSLAMSATHALAGRAVIRAEELVNDAMVVRRQCELLAQTSRHFTARGVRPHFAAKTMSDCRAMSYVRAGLGVTVMPDCFVQTGVVRVPLEDFAYTRDIGLVYAPHVNSERARHGALVQLFIETIERAREN